MHLLFDLDGTLTDSSPGIVRSINHALEQLGRPCVADERLRRMIGAPLADIFAAVLACDDEREVDRAVAAYRVRYNEAGMFEASLVPGVGGCLASLSGAGHTLQVVTAKPALVGARVLAHFGIDRFFHAVHGPALTDRSCNKADLIRTALTARPAADGDAAMIGDRADDVHAARAQNVFAVAVTWGYGDREELDAAGPDFVAERFADLLAWIETRTGRT